MISISCERTRWSLLAILCVLASVLVPGIASVSTAVGAETRVWASDFADQDFVGLERSLTLELYRGCEPTCDQLASDSLLGARGTLRGGAQAGGITSAEAQRIQNAANRIGKPIDVVGGRARGKTTGDYDYVIDANAKVRNSASSSLPGAGNVSEGVRPNIDVFKGPVDPARPSIRFEPEGP